MNPLLYKFEQWLMIFQQIIKSLGPFQKGYRWSILKLNQIYIITYSIWEFSMDHVEVLKKNS
jgi:hypothetical protein